MTTRGDWLELARATGVLTPKQMEALEVWATGCGFTVGARRLRLPRDTYRGRVHRALARLENAAAVNPQDAVCPPAQ